MSIRVKRCLTPLAVTVILLAMLHKPASAESHRYTSWPEFFEAYTTKAGAVYVVYAGVRDYQVNTLGRPVTVAKLHAGWAAAVAWIAYDQFIMGPRVAATLEEWVQSE